MWMSYLIDGLDDGRFAFYIKLHHTVMDGVAGFQMIADALSTDPDRPLDARFYADRHREPGAPSNHEGYGCPIPSRCFGRWWLPRPRALRSPSESSPARYRMWWQA